MEDVIFQVLQIDHQKYFWGCLVADNQDKDGPAQYKEFDEVTVKEKLRKIKVQNTILMIRVRARDVQTLFADLSAGAPLPLW